MQQTMVRSRANNRNRDTTRTCALTRQTKPNDELIRFVLSPEGEIVPDVDARAPGRGVWISLDFECVNRAALKDVFSRSLKLKVAVSPELAQITRTRLEQRAMGALGLARKAGQLQTGATRVRSTINSGEAIALLTAKDAAPDGRRKMLVVLRNSGHEPEVTHLDIFSSSQLGLALGQENVIHAALTHGAAGKSALLRVERAARYLAEKSAEASAEASAEQSERDEY